MNRKLSKVIAIVLSLLMFCSPLTAFANDDNTGKYVKEVFISTANSEEKAKSYLTKHGYKVVDINLNEETSSKKCVYIGYKTTKDYNDAITDLQVMNMNGGYSQTEYEKLVKDKRSVIKKDIKDLRVVINEFRENYKAGEPMAKQAYENLNKYQDKKEDSSANLKCDEGKTDKLMGDYFLDESITDDQLTTLFMQGNAKLFETLYQNLALGIFKKSDKPVVEKFAALDLDDEYSSKYDKTASVLASYVPNMVEHLKEYEESDIHFDDDKDEVNDYLTSADQDDKLKLIKYGALYKMLEAVEFGDGTLLDYFMDNEETRTKDMYALASVLTPAQAIILPHIGLESLLVIKASEETADNISIDKQIKAMDVKVADFKPVSMYEGVDQDLFGGDVALTTYALAQSLSTGDNPWYQGNVGIGYEIAMYTFAATALVGVLVTGITYWAKSAYIASIPEKVAEAEEIARDCYRSMCLFSGRYQGFFKEVVADESLYTPMQKAILKSYASMQKDFDAAREYYQSVKELQENLPTTGYWGTATLIATGVLLIASGVYLGVELYNYYHPEYKEIPSIMCNEYRNVWNPKQPARYVYYYATKQHYDGDTKGEYGEYGDLNGFSGKQWLALYSIKDLGVGKPIVEDGFLTRVYESERQYQAISQFNIYARAYNLNSHQYTDKSGGLYLTYNVEYDYQNDTTGSVFSSGSVALIAGIGVALGLIVGSTVTYFAVKNKRKKEENSITTTE